MVTVKFANIRVDLRNKTTYAVIKKTDKETREVRYALFFNLNGGGYREFIAFKDKKDADFIANIVDTIDGNLTSYINNGEKKGFYYVCNINTGCHVPRCKDDDQTYENEFYILNNSAFVDLTEIVEKFGLKPVNVKECE